MAYIVDLFAAVVCRPWGNGVSFKSGVVLSQRLMVNPVSTAITLGGNTEGVLGRADRAHKEGGMGGK